MGKYGFDPNTEVQKIDEKIIEEIVEIAKVHYGKLSGTQQAEAKKIYKKANKEKAGDIAFNNYNAYFKTKVKMFSSEEFFDMLTKNRKVLEIHEFFAVHYLCACCRYCNQCKKFLGGAYFTCVQCFNGSDDTCDLCSACYRKNEFKHKQHAAAAEFHDNYALLEAKRNQSSATQNTKTEASPSALARNTPKDLVLADMRKFFYSKK